MTCIEIVAGRHWLTDRRIVELGSASFGVDAQEYREYLEWKHEQNPYSPEPLVYAALDENERAVGMRTFYGTRWSTGGGETDIPAADDFAIAPAHRHSGLATSLMRSALSDLNKRGFEYVVSTSAGQVTALQSLAVGWKSVEPWSLRSGFRGDSGASRRPRTSPTPHPTGVATIQTAESWSRRFRIRSA